MSAAPSDDACRGLVLRPLRALRYAAGSGLGALTSPPYDVLDPATADALRAGNPRNVVQLIRPSTGGYGAVAGRLQRWTAEGVLVRDPQPALYVYEYDVGGHVVRGLVGALGLRDPAEKVVLPHEDVMAGPVHDRVALMRQTSAQLEPILLVYDGGGPASQVVDRVSATPPLVSTVAPDGSSHRVWRASDPDDHVTVGEDLRDRQALIADGHHRYAAYRRCQQAASPTTVDGAWDYGLAMLVDQRHTPLSLGPIHRVVDGVDLASLALDLSGEGKGGKVGEVGKVQDLGADGATARRTWESAEARSDEAIMLLTQHDRWLMARLPRGEAVVDAGVLHERLLPSWSVAERQVRYLHDFHAAVATAAASRGVAVLLRSPDLGQVVAASARGVLLPRKSTSFGPKPRMGLLMRQLDA